MAWTTASTFLVRWDSSRMIRRTWCSLLARADIAHDPGEEAPVLERPLGQGEIERHLASVLAAPLIRGRY